MENEQIIKSIKNRIISEYKKHPDLEWAEIAARKIYSELHQPPVITSLPNGKRVLAALKELSDCFTDEERKTMFINDKTIE